MRRRIRTAPPTRKAARTIIRKYPVDWSWTGDPVYRPDAHGKMHLAIPGRKTSVSLWIHDHLKSTIRYDYGYRMWKTCVDDMRKRDIAAKTPPWSNFRVIIYTLTRLGLIRQLDYTEIEDRLIESDGTVSQPVGSPVGARRGKKDWPTVWYEIHPDTVAVNNLRTHVTREEMPDDIFYTYAFNHLSKKWDKLDALIVAWSDPKRALYAKSYADNMPRMKAARHKERKETKRQMSRRSIILQIRVLENELERRGYKVKRREFTTEEIKETKRSKYLKKKLEKEAEKTRRRHLRGLSAMYPPEWVAVEEIKKMAVDLALKYQAADFNREPELMEQFKYLVEHYNLKKDEWALAVDRGEGEALAIDFEKDPDVVLRYIQDMVRHEVSAPIVDVRSGKIAFRQPDPVTLSIVKSLQHLHFLKREDVQAAVDEGMRRGNEDAQKITETEEKVKEPKPSEEEEGEGGE